MWFENAALFERHFFVFDPSGRGSEHRQAEAQEPSQERQQGVGGELHSRQEEDRLDPLPQDQDEGQSEEPHPDRPLAARARVPRVPR